MKELAPGIVIFDNVFLNAKKHIRKIEDSNISWRPAEVLADQEKNISETNYNARDTDLIMLPIPNSFSESDPVLAEFTEEFYAEIDPFLQEYFKHYHANINSKEQPQLLRYGKGQQFHDHIDDHPFFTRRISITFYINDEYEGGEIEFNRFNLKISAKANQLLIFPSNFIYNHQVHAVTEGTRYVVVQWMA